jgi:hypothetical protein
MIVGSLEVVTTQLPTWTGENQQNLEVDTCCFGQDWSPEFPEPLSEELQPDGYCLVCAM